MAIIQARLSAKCLHIQQKAPPSHLFPFMYCSPIRKFTSHQIHTTPTPSADYIPQQPRYPQEQPRWQQTPRRMTAPFRSKPPVEGNDFAVNEDPQKLDRVYENVLGEGGDEMLTDEVKWLAVTHKSFDHGRRGFNDRLSFLGRRIVELQTSLALINNASTTPKPRLPKGLPNDDSQPYNHSALQGLEGLTTQQKLISLDQHRIAKLGQRYGLDAVVRWKPKVASRLKESGLSLVLQQALYAIIGAVALQKGGQVANDAVRERILSPLGLYQSQ